MLDPQIIAKSFLTQIEQRRDFLAPLRSISEQGWYILLLIYCARTTAEQDAERIAVAIDTPQSTANRMFDLLEQHGYVSQQHIEQNNVLELSNSARHKIELMLRQMSAAIPTAGS